MLERGAVTSEQGVLLSHSMGSLWGYRSFWPGAWDQEGPCSARAGLCSCEEGGTPGGQAGAWVLSNLLCLERQLDVEFCPWLGPALTQDLLPWSLGTAMAGVPVFEGLSKVLGQYNETWFCC